MFTVGETGTDGALVVEVIELTRDEMLPAAADVRTLSALATLNATATDTTVAEPMEGTATADATADRAAAVSVLRGLSPVRRPPRVRIGSGFRLPRLDASLAEIAVDPELAGVTRAHRRQPRRLHPSPHQCPTRPQN